MALFASARTPGAAGCFARDEALLVEQARTLGYRLFVKALAYWGQLADPEGPERSAERWHADRRLHLSRPSTGPGHSTGSSTRSTGRVIAAALGRIDRELFEADWAEAKARVDDGVCAGDLARTPAQRRADALVEMATWPPSTVRSTTCSRGRRAGSPPRTTGGWRAGSTTGSDRRQGPAVRELAAAGLLKSA